MMSWFYWVFTSMAVTDYDPDYLYLFTKTGTVQIPLGHFYKLRSGRSTWYLHYKDAQNRKQKLMIVPIQATFSWAEDNPSINGFSDAVQQHNPNLDLDHGWPKQVG